MSYFQIKDGGTYFDWVGDTFLPNYFALNDLAGNRLHWRDRKFMNDWTSYRIGPARIRQLRTKTCTHTSFH